MTWNVDDNQKAIIAALRKQGYSVQSLAGTGRGVPDLLVGAVNRNILLEVKNPQGRNRSTPYQVEWAAKWQGQMAVVRSVEEALAVVSRAGLA